jgi:probable F420-dependent oxidoreductase
MTEQARRPLKVGIFVPIIEGAMGGGTPRWRDIIAIGRKAEEVGFDSLWFPDHMIFQEGADRFGQWDAWSIISALAAATSRVEIGPLVACTSFRNPTLIAKMADTIDEISGGRLVLGLGAGWNEVEYAAFGFPFDHRVSRFEEAFTIVRTLLREGSIDFSGKYYQTRDCVLQPRGPRPGGVPIMIGSTGERMLRLAARYADAWNAWPPRLYGEGEVPDPRVGVPRVRATVDAACHDVGRDPATLERTVAVFVELPGFADISKGPSITRVPHTGSPEEIAEALRAYAREGISHVQVVLHPNTVEGVERFGRVLEILDRGT